MERTKRQHFVPQVYLRRFAHDGKSVFVFDKSNGSVFETSTLNVAQERYFYDVSPEITENADAQALEHIFSEMETEYAALVESMLASLSKKRRINPKHKLRMTLFVVIQYLRTKEYRERSAELRERQLEAINDALSRDGLRMKWGHKEEAANHLISMFDPGLLNALTDVLQNHIWLVWNNKTAQPFYASDSPVVVASRFQVAAGFASPGAEVVLPLTPRFLLVMCNRKSFPELAKHDLKVVSLYDESRVEYYNRQQIRQSTRQIFSAENEFSFARRICELEPDIRDPKRRRIEVNKSGNLVEYSDK